jgi:hypothetical protein
MLVTIGLRVYFNRILLLKNEALDKLIKFRFQNLKALILIHFICLSFPNFVFAQSKNIQSHLNSYTFKLNRTATTSAGIFTSDSTLVRTLWSCVTHPAGTYPITWDGKDDDGNIMPAGNYIAKVVSNNVKYTWEGVAGNTSTNTSGSTVHRQWVYSMCDMVVVNGTAYYCSGYSEGRPSVNKLLTKMPQQKLNIFAGNVTNKQTEFCCSDGTIVYWAGFDPYNKVSSWVSGTFVNDDKDVKFSDGIIFSGKHTRQENAISLLQVANSKITGMAVQKAGAYLFVSRAALNSLYVLNKTTGALVQTIPLTNVRNLSVDGSDNLWIVYGTNTVEKFKVNSTGGITTTGITLSGVTTPGAMGMDNANDKLLIIDYSTQQVKFYHISTGAVHSQSILGQSGGYSINTSAANDKFCFTTQASGNYLSFVRVNSADGSFYVGDSGNNRIQHFTANGTFIETIMYLQPSYSTWVDTGNPTRIGAEWFEFKIDYTKPLSGNTGWTFANNWGASIPAAYNQKEMFKSVHTFTSGGISRTFGFIKIGGDGPCEIVELQSNNILRFTGIIKPWYVIDENGYLYLRSVPFSRYPFIGFDEKNNPVWSSTPDLLADISTLPNRGPIFGVVPFQQNPVTSTNKVIFFHPQTYSGANKVWNTGYHLGAIIKGSNKWLWETEHATNINYKGDFPPPGIFDIGNMVNYSSGSRVCVLGRNIITGYHGEFWKSNQTNKFNHYLDNGLAIGQFGVTGLDSYIEAPPMMAGNNFTPALIAGRTSDEMYLWHGDESYHAGIHRWKITGLNSIQEQDIPIQFPSNLLTPAPAPGINLLAELPFQDTIKNGAYGWSRSNNEDYTNIHNKYFTVVTGVKSYLNSQADIYVHYRQPLGIYTVTRDLGSNSDLTSWTVSGKLSLERNYPNDSKGTGGAYIEILDRSGKIIARFYENYTQAPVGHTDYIWGNNKVLVQKADPDMKLITGHSQPFEISTFNNTVSFKYAGYAATSQLLDPTANWRNPKTFRLYFWTNKNGQNDDKIIDLQSLRFVSNP